MDDRGPRRDGDQVGRRFMESEPGALGSALEPIADEDRLLVGRDGGDLVVRVRADPGDRRTAGADIEFVDVTIGHRFPNGSLAFTRHRAARTLKKENL